MKLPPGYVAGEGVLKPSVLGGFGERMLKSMGWNKGQGLGRNADGIKEAIQVKKKEDTVGVRPGADYCLALGAAASALEEPQHRAHRSYTTKLSTLLPPQIGAKPTWEWEKKYWEEAYESVQLTAGVRGPGRGRPAASSRRLLPLS